MAFNKIDCHGVYLIFYNSIKDNIKSKNDLIKILRESGRHVDNSGISKYWKPDTKEITFDDYINICREVPIMTKTDLVKSLKSLDINRQGIFDKSEFIGAFSTTESKLSRRDLLDILNKIDVKDEGKIKIEELADLLLSNLENFKTLGRQKLAEKEGKSQNISGEVIQAKSSNQLNTPKKSLSKINDDENENDKVLELQKSKENGDEIRIEKITSSKFEYNEPKNLKTWRKTTLRGCLFLTDNSNSNCAQDPYIETYMYKFTLKTTNNVFILLSPLNILKKFDLRQVPDLGFIILNKNEEIVALSTPVDASGSVYFSGSLNAGSYVVLPFTTGAKLKSKANEAKDNFKNIRPLKKDANNEDTFTEEIMTMLNDIFKICDIDGNGYLNKEEFIWYSSKTSEDEWEEDMWDEVKSCITLHNDELSFSNFTQLIMKEVKEEKNPASLFLTFDLFGFNDKCMIDEAVPFSITFADENSDHWAKCFGIHNKTTLIESSLRDFVISQGEKIIPKGNWKDCNLYMWYKQGRILMSVENCSPASKQVPLRLLIDMEKSMNLVVYKDKLKRSVSIASGMKILAVHGVPIEPKISISCECSIRRS